MTYSLIFHLITINSLFHAFFYRFKKVLSQDKSLKVQSLIKKNYENNGTLVIRNREMICQVLIFRTETCDTLQVL